MSPCLRDTKMCNILLTWIGNALYCTLRLVMQSLLRDDTMFYGKIYGNYSKKNGGVAQTYQPYRTGAPSYDETSVRAFPIHPNFAAVAKLPLQNRCH